jgi:hypothetical protein
MACLLTVVGLHADAAEQLKIALSLPEIDTKTRREYEQRMRQGLEAAKSPTGATADYYKLLGVEQTAALDQVGYHGTFVFFGLTECLITL